MAGTAHRGGPAGGDIGLKESYINIRQNMSDIGAETRISPRGASARRDADVRRWGLAGHWVEGEQDDVVAVHGDGNQEGAVFCGAHGCGLFGLVAGEVVEMRDLGGGQLLRGSDFEIGGVGVVGVEAGAMEFEAIGSAGDEVLYVQDDGRGGMCGLDFGVEGMIADVLDRLFKVPHQGLQAFAIAGEHGLRVGGGDGVALERVEVLVGEEGGLADALGIEESEAALEGSGGRTRLLEEIGVGPVAHALHQSLAGFELAEDVGGADVGVVHGVAGGVTGTPLGEVERQVGKRRMGDLLAHAADVADDGVGGWIEPGVAFAVFVEEATLHAVGVGADEVDGSAAGFDVGEKLGDPGGAGCGGTADAEGRIDGLDGAGSQVVEGEVSLLIATFPEAGEVGFVPDFEVPGADLIGAVALFDVADEGGDEVVPALRVGMRGIAVPVKDAVGGGGQRFGREAEFDERLDVAGQQIVIELVDAGPVVDGFAVFDADGAEHVMKDGVEANVAEAEFVDGEFELGLAVGADEGAGIVRADGEVEEAVDRTGGVVQVGHNDAGGGRLGGQHAA